MKKKTYSRNRDVPEDLFDESDDYFGPDLSAPKHCPMQRKSKFRTKNFKTKEKHKDRKRNLRNKIRYDFEL